MLDHVTLAVGDIERARRFYDAALEPLGYHRLSDFTEHGLAAAGYGPEYPMMHFFAVCDGTAPVVMPGHHIAFMAPSRAAVDAFHAAGLAAGGTDNGGPGLRPTYHPNYYAAFVIDPDGHHIEAVCHREA